MLVFRSNCPAVKLSGMRALEFDKTTQLERCQYERCTYALEFDKTTQLERCQYERCTYAFELDKSSSISEV